MFWKPSAGESTAPPRVVGRELARVPDLEGGRGGRGGNVWIGDFGVGGVGTGASTFKRLTMFKASSANDFVAACSSANLSRSNESSSM